MEKKVKTKKVTFTLNSDVIEKLEIVSKESMISKSKLISNLIDKYIIDDRISNIEENLTILKHFTAGKVIDEMTHEERNVWLNYKKSK